MSDSEIAREGQRTRDMEDPRSVREIAEQVVSQLEARPWIRGRLHRVDNSVCGMGALFACRYSDEYLENGFCFMTRAEYRLMAAFEEVVGESVPQFNDYRARGKQDVIDAFNRVIKREIERDEPR